MIYKPIYTINLKHGYYSDGRCPDLALVPSEECKRLLRRYRLLFREYPSSYQLLCPKTATSDYQMPLDKGLKFRFYLKLKNPGFARVTKMPVAIDVKDILQGYRFLHYSNVPDSTSTPEILTASTYEHETKETHRVREPAKKEGFFLKHKPVPGLDESAFLVGELAQDHAEKHVDEYDKAMKKVIIDTSAYLKDHLFYLKYRTVPTWHHQVWGVVDITNHDSDPKPKVFEMKFQPKAVFWKYYVLVPDLYYDDLSLKDVLVTDETETMEVTFKKADITTQPAADPIALWLKEKYPKSLFPDLKKVLFTSEKAIPYQESHRKKIQLQCNEQVVRPNLPFPSSSNGEYQIINIQNLTLAMSA